MIDPPLLLTVRDRDYSGWLRVRVDRSVENSTISFGVIGTRDWPGMAESWDIAPGDRVNVQMGETPIVNGWIDQVSPSYGGDSHEIEIAGRGLVADLVDCTPLGAPIAWKATPAGVIIADIAAPFGVSVVIDADLGGPMDFKLQQGETGWNAIERLTRLRQMLAYEQADGSLLITRVSTEYCDTPLIQGTGERTILAASATLDDRDRFSDVIVKGQQPGGNEVSPTQAAQSLGDAKDPSITRYRPLVIYQAAKTSNLDALERARWEVANRWGKGRTATIEVTGWLTDGGIPWPINRLCRIEDAWLGIDREMAITRTIFELGAQGTKTTLTLQPPEALTPNPDELPNEITNKEGGTGTDFWAQVGADRRRGEARRLESKQ